MSTADSKGGLGGLGGLIAIAGGVLFLVVILLALRGRSSKAAEDLEHQQG